MLVSFLPANWQDLAVETGALKGLRKNKSAENLLRVLLLHLGCGHSLLETSVRARQEGLAELSSVALWNRLRKSQAWLRSLCLELFRERGVGLSEDGGFQVRRWMRRRSGSPAGPGRCGACTKACGCRRWPATSSG